VSERTEARKAYEKAWRAANPESTTAARKRWEAKHPEYWKERYIKEKPKHLARMRQRYLDNPEAVKKRTRRNVLKKKYGLTPESLAVLMDQHNNRCAICDGTHKLVIDHDHDSGAVRGILCNACNVGLGRFKDNGTLLYKAAMYLMTTTKMREVS
jgi:hypothetical protein